MHDYAGHPFQVELSRRLAIDGYKVWHLYSDDTVSGKGALDLSEKDPDRLHIEAIRPRSRYARYSPIGRIRFELSYGRALAHAIAGCEADVVITGNTPLFVLLVLMRYLNSRSIKWVLWHQDMVSLAVSDEAARVLP